MRKLTLKLITILLGTAGFASVSDAQTVYGLLSGGTSFTTFDVSTPGTLSAPVTITGLDEATGDGEKIRAIDFRPSDGKLYGFSSFIRLFTIANNGVATLFKDLSTLTPVVTPANGSGSDDSSDSNPNSDVSIDVNPTANSNLGALRIVDTSAQNFRFIFDASDATSLNGDDTLTYQVLPPAGGIPQVIGAAYTNNDTAPATPTSLYVVDALTNSVYLQNAPNDGLLTNGISLGIDVPTTDVGFDVPLGGANLAYLSMNDLFYSLTVGTAPTPLNLIGQIGNGNDALVVDIAIIPEPATNFLLFSGLGAVLFAGRRLRSRDAKSV